MLFVNGRVVTTEVVKSFDKVEYILYTSGMEDKKHETTEYLGNKTLAETAYGFLSKAILNKEYETGEMISEAEISKKLGISRTPVREALKLLEKEKLVKVYPKRGAIITGVPLNKIKEIFQIREMFEGEIAKAVTKKISLESLEEIEKNLQLIRNEANINPEKKAEAIGMGLKLHDLILCTSGNQTLIDFMNRLKIDQARGCDIATVEAGNMGKFLDQHLEIIRALKEGDGDKVKELIISHVKDAKKSVLEFEEQTGL